ncbi:MAG: sodium-dependent transporter [Gammaproteobacteria bacterium]|nr:sodium-dependent transporter [Gammaproteobacteria bacterium]MDP2141864.1 sodium-dependent transporter [Gammaproteobacteria bacterium]MDP2348185.1 sodium-dependent transporter [Gammaproteobacteria bacterium]
MAIERGQFSSKLGFILAAAGSAVGLGNLVAFPVMASKNGGAVFLFVYVLFVALICLPVMMAEIAMGRRTQRNPVGAFVALSDGSRGWRMAGNLAILTPFMIAVFYTIVTVWIVIYLLKALTGGLGELALPETFGGMVGSPSVFIYFVVVQILVFAVLLSGVKKGIERQAKILMPTLAVMLVGLIIFVMTLDNASAGIRYYLVPDFSQLDSTVVNAALNQAFFSLSLGMGIMITYGSYFSSSDSIPGSSRLVAIADTGVAFLAGLLILPAIFAFNPATNPEDLSSSSVGLIFTYLPQIFLSMQGAVGMVGASIVAAVFFALVFFAAFTSLVSILEIPISYMIDEWSFSRTRAVLTQAALVSFFAIFAAMSFGMSPFLTDFIPYGGGPKSFFDLLADTFSEVILPFVGFLACTLCAYRWRNGGLSSELVVGDDSYAGSLAEKYINFSLRTFIPVVLLFVFLNSLSQKYFAFDLLSLI